MSCYGCLTKFSFFTREHSCPNCGLSYCSKCLRDKITLQEKEKNVCKNCFKKFTSRTEAMASSDADIPDLLVKRLETLENPSKPPITIFRHSNRLMNLRSGLSSQDKEILERLEKLKAERTAPKQTDEDEIKRRLALLQGRSDDSLSEKPQTQIFVTKSEQEQVDDLLKQYMIETGLDENLKSTGNQAMDEIREKLNKLKTSDGEQSPKRNSVFADMENSDAVTARIIKRAIAEGQLEKRLNMPNDDDDDDDDDDIDMSDTEQENEELELSWCIICNENATIKCFGCDGNLYCSSCFKQGHEFFNMENHTFVPYQKEDSTP